MLTKFRLIKVAPTFRIVRNIQIAFPIGLWAVSVVSDYLWGRTNQRRERAQQLQRAISRLGPALIKGGQALASRPDLLPKEYLEELQSLQDNVPPFDCKRAFKIVEEELGAKFEDVFELGKPYMIFCCFKLLKLIPMKMTQSRKSQLRLLPLDKYTK